MKLTKHNAAPETIEIEDATFEIVCMKQSHKLKTQTFLAQGIGDKIAQSLIENGVKKVEGVESHKGKPVKNGYGLWKALDESGEDGGELISELINKIMVKNGFIDDEEEETLEKN